MKNTLLKIFSFLLIIPCLFLCACSNSKNLNLSAYFESPIKATVLKNNKNTEKELTISDITSKKPVTTKLDTYLQFNLTGINEFVYRLYIEKIEFYVYSNKDAAEMTLNLAMSNLAEKSNLSITSTLTESVAIIPEADESILVTFKINRVVATATGSTLAIDILESKNSTITDSVGNETGFKWIIHGFKIFGEHYTN